MEFFIEHFKAGISVNASWLVLYFIINALIHISHISDNPNNRFHVNIFSFLIILIIMLVASYWSPTL